MVLKEISRRKLQEITETCLPDLMYGERFDDGVRCESLGG